MEPTGGAGRVRTFRVRRGAPYKTLFRVPVLAAGIQLGWALQLSLLTPYVQELGIPHAWASWIWLCGPITGLIAQPIVGHYSDQCLSSWGRRRPFIVAGTCTVTVAVFLIGFSADLGWMLGDNSVEGRMRPWAIGIFIIGFWLLDLANNIIQGPLRALLADMAGRDTRRVRAANGFYSSWMAAGNIAGFAAGSYSGWHRIFPFTLTDGCSEPCANLKSAFLIAVAALWLTTAITVFSSIDPWRPMVEIESSLPPSDLTAPLISSPKPESPTHRDAGPRERESGHEHTHAVVGGSETPHSAPHSPRSPHHEKKKSGHVPGLTTTLSTPDLILWELEKMEEKEAELEAEAAAAEEGGEGGGVTGGEGPAMATTHGKEAEVVEEGKNEQQERKGELSKALPKGIVPVTVDESRGRPTLREDLPVSMRASEGREYPSGAQEGEGLLPRRGRDGEDRSIKWGEGQRNGGRVGGDEEEEEDEEEELEEEEEQRTWLLWELIAAMEVLPRPVWFVMLVLVFTWMAQFPFLLFDTDWMGRDIFRGSPAATGATAELYYKGVHSGSFGLVLNSIVSGVTSIALEPICRRIGTKWAWVAGNSVLSATLGLTAVVTKIASHHRVVVGGMPRGPPPLVRYSALGIFAAIGIPIAVTGVVPYSLAATYTQGTGGGQGLTMGVVNLAIVVPQIVVSIVSGPWDELFGGGNVPAFLAGSALAFAGAVVACFVLRNPPPEQRDRQARLRRTLSSPV